MKLLFDQNISSRILKLLPKEYSGSSHVKFENLINFPDYKIWEYARINNFTIVTQDSDFNEISHLRGFPPKIIWIRIGSTKTKEIIKILMDLHHEINNFIANEEYACF